MQAKCFRVSRDDKADHCLFRADGALVAAGIPDEKTAVILAAAPVLAELLPALLALAVIDNYDAFADPAEAVRVRHRLTERASVVLARVMAAGGGEE